MRALVTGVSGFIGSHLAASLQAQGIDVVGLVRPTSQLNRPLNGRLKLVHGDVRDPQSLRGAVESVDVVYHLAGLTKVRRAKQFMQANALGTAHVVAACTRRTSPPALVLVSSLAAAGPSPADRLRTERDPARPVSNYGRSKLAAEQIVRTAANRLPVTIVRPPIVIGPGDVNLAEFMTIVEKLRVHVVPTLRNYRYSLIHVEDLVTGIRLAAERGRRLAACGQDSGEQAGIYFLAADEHPTYAQLGHMMGAATNRNGIRVVHLPSWLVGGIAMANELVAQIRRQPSLLNLDKIREATAGAWACSPERAQTELGFRVAAPLQMRMREVGEAFLRHQRATGAVLTPA